MKVIPTAAALGAEIARVDLSRPLDDATFAAIERAYNEYGVIFIRGQSITPAQQVAFTRRFGEIEFNIFGERWSVLGNPEIVVLSNITEGGRPPASAALVRTGTATCATPRDRRAGPSCTPSRSPSCTGSRSETPSSPAPLRPGMLCRMR
jgi:alpha-ketoglutarate-dependent taurine dioxygenase